LSQKDPGARILRLDPHKRFAVGDPFFFAPQALQSYRTGFQRARMPRI